MSNSNYNYDVFVSYNHTDYGFVHNYLIPILHSWGRKVMVDVEEFEYGEGLEDLMKKKIQQSERILFVCSRYWKGSKACQYELKAALKDEEKMKSNLLLPLVLDEHKSAPEELNSNAYCDLSKDVGKKSKWKRICEFSKGSWTNESDDMLEKMKDQVSFFGDFLNNKTKTVILNRAHPVSESIQGVDTEFMVDKPTINTFAPVLMLLGQIGKVENVEIALSNNGWLPKGLPTKDTNYVCIGGSGGAQLIEHFAKKDAAENNDYPDWLLKYAKTNTGHDKWDYHNHAYLICKLPSSPRRGQVIHLFSPWGGHSYLACQKLLQEYRRYTMEFKDNGFLLVFDSEGRELEAERRVYEPS